MRGHHVQPFKCGPDYIDPIHHGTAAGRQSINLDAYMMSAGHIRHLYQRWAGDADIAITEGVMGLFDGSQKREGSSADLAILLGLPVILILNAKAMAYSAAALLYGLKNFDPALPIAGVIFNFVDSPSHYRLLQEACDDLGIRALGHLPANDGLHIPSRHLGLDTTDAREAINAAAQHVEQHLDLEKILQATVSPRPARSPEPRPTRQSEKTILVARDPAFQFLYPENLRHLENYGRIRYFSPLTTGHLPPGDGLYLPGGYPELYLRQLADNKTLLNEINLFARSGGSVLAECGGMMFLGRSIIGSDGVRYPMTGVLDIETTMEAGKLQIGYRTVHIGDKTVKGHEFHYSQFSGTPSPNPAIVVTNARGDQLPTPFFYRQNLLASYLHFYWAETPNAIDDWLARIPG
jgi:cobyrinic acid a,c-diamide synthase